MAGKVGDDFWQSFNGALYKTFLVIMRRLRVLFVGKCWCFVGTVLVIL